LVEVIDELAESEVLTAFSKVAASRKGTIRFQGGEKVSDAVLFLSDGSRRRLPFEIELAAFTRLSFLVLQTDRIPVAGTVVAMPGEIRVVPITPWIALAAVNVVGVASSEVVSLDGSVLGMGERTLCVSPNDRHEIRAGTRAEGAVIHAHPGARLTVDLGQPGVSPKYAADQATTANKSQLPTVLSSRDECRLLCADYAIALATVVDSASAAAAGNECMARCEAGGEQIVDCLRKATDADSFLVCVPAEAHVEREHTKDAKSCCASYGVAMTRKTGLRSLYLAQRCVSRCKQESDSFFDSFCKCVMEARTDSDFEKCAWK